MHLPQYHYHMPWALPRPRGGSDFLSLATVLSRIGGHAASDASNDMSISTASLLSACPPNAVYLLHVRVVHLPRHVRHLSALPAVILLPSSSLRLLSLRRQRLMRHDHLCTSTCARGNAASRSHLRTLRPCFISPLRRQHERPVPVLIRSMVHQMLLGLPALIPLTQPATQPPRASPPR
jgi:hypothetical protein